LIFDSNVVTLIPGIILMISTLGLSGGPHQKYADLSLITGAIVAFLFIAWGKGAFWGYWSVHPPLIWIGIFLSFHAIIGADLLSDLYARFYNHVGSEFNRRNGTLTIARRFRKPLVAPFDEFDPVMQLLPTGHDGHDYALWLRHRYDGTKVCLARK